MHKRFPLKKITKSKQFYIQYINEKNNLLRNINFKELDRIIDTIKKCLKSNVETLFCSGEAYSFPKLR